MTESFIEKLLKRPYVIYACLALFMCLGAAGYLQSDRNLFPDSNYPEIAVVMVEPGASAKSLRPMWPCRWKKNLTP